jgi:hypothetical protein
LVLLEPDHLPLAGYAQYRPVENNGTDDGRRRNRHVDLVVVSLPPAAETHSQAAELLIRVSYRLAALAL